jgi:hypothetical protein
VLTRTVRSPPAAPTDAAFAAVPAAQRQARLADRPAVADMVRAHVVPGYYPPGSLGKGGFNRTVFLLKSSRCCLISLGEIAYGQG